MYTPIVVGSRSVSTVARSHAPSSGVEIVNKKFGTTQLHMSEGFPLQKEGMLAIFQVMSATDAQYDSLERFFSTRLPSGFPVRFALPVLPAISALVTFERCELKSPDAALFEIPADYKAGGFKNFLERNKIE